MIIYYLNIKNKKYLYNNYINNFFNSYFRQFSFAILLFQSLFQISSSQDFSELIQPMCSKKQIKYTIVADMMTYLETI